MKLAEQTKVEDDRLLVKRTFDTNSHLQAARRMRDANGGIYGEDRLVARIPTWLMAEWAKEAGIRMDDPAFRDVVDRKLMGGEFSKFRVWGGTY